MNLLRLFLVAIIMLVATLILLPWHLLALILAHSSINWRMAQSASRFMPMAWHKTACWAIGLKIRTKGALSTHRPIMITANHASWVDILVLGACAPVSFIAKSEVASWPLFGHLAKLQRTIFVDRQRRQNTGQKVAEISQRMKMGDVIVLFPEGTTSDGNYVLPFKSALFGAVQKAQDDFDDHAVFIQPVSIAYISAHGLPLGRANRDLIAWPGDIALLPHLKQVLLEGSIGVEVTFTEPIEFHETMSRRAVAAQSEASVRKALNSSLSGR